MKICTDRNTTPVFRELVPRNYSGVAGCRLGNVWLGAVRGCVGRWRGPPSTGIGRRPCTCAAETTPWRGTGRVLGGR